MSKDQPEVEIVRRAVLSLGEHFDPVQIFVTRSEECGKQLTTNINLGSGNWFARYGQVKEWVVKEEEASRIEIRRYEERERE